MLAHDWIKVVCDAVTGQYDNITWYRSQTEDAFAVSTSYVDDFERVNYSWCCAGGCGVLNLEHVQCP